jgi:hypothetical protein
MNITFLILGVFIGFLLVLMAIAFHRIAVLTRVSYSQLQLIRALGDSIKDLINVM